MNIDSVYMIILVLILLSDSENIVISNDYLAMDKSKYLVMQLRINMIIQSNFNGSNTFGTMKISSKQG